MPDFLLFAAIMFFALRLNKTRRLWRLPMKNGEDRFLTEPVPPNFYREVGAALLKRYRVALLVLLLFDMPLSLWFLLSHRNTLLFVEQFIAMLISVVVSNLIFVHFCYRAQEATGSVQERPATTLQLSMSPRRLRDHTNWTIEIVIVTAMMLAAAMLVRAYVSEIDKVESHVRSILRGGIVVTIWIAYLQLGLLLLKIVFVRWRMPLPARKTDEFRQWRTAWLSYHLRIFDSIRVLSATILVSGVWIKLTWGGWSRSAVIAGGAIWIPALAWFIIFAIREGRHIAAVQKD